jgi:hypothetical protein
MILMDGKEPLSDFKRLKFAREEFTGVLRVSILQDYGFPF